MAQLCLVKSVKLYKNFVKTKFFSSKKAAFAGFAAAAPICLGYIPIGFAFGVLAQKSGLTLLQVLVMSLVAFAGSAQFIAVGMLAMGATGASIIITTFVVNLRHLLMSSTLALYLKQTKIAKLALFAHTVTDESFGVNINKFKKSSWGFPQALVANYTAYFTWATATSVGAVGGFLIPEGAFGIDYALIAMFIALLALQIDELQKVVTALLAALLALFLSLILDGNLHIFIAAVVAPTFVVLFGQVGGRANKRGGKL